jgi:hypothetical protein
VFGKINRRKAIVQLGGKMKKAVLMFLALAVIFSCSTAYARRQINSIRLRMATNNQAVTDYWFYETSTTHWSNPISCFDSTGDAILKIDFRANAATKVINSVTYELSDDGVNFYEPKEIVGTSPFSVATIVNGVTADAYIKFTHAPAKYIRFNIQANAVGTYATVTYIYQTTD